MNAAELMFRLYENRFKIDVQFGDCDPAGIVFLPELFEMDGCCASLGFVSHGVPPWRELVKTTGIIGTPLAGDQHPLRQAGNLQRINQDTYRDHRWRPKVFIIRHIVMRGETLLLRAPRFARFAFGRRPDQGG